MENADLVGLDLTLAIHEYVLPHLDRTPGPAPLLREHVARGELGMKTGRGLRDWAPDRGAGGARPSPRPPHGPPVAACARPHLRTDRADRDEGRQPESSDDPRGDRGGARARREAGAAVVHVHVRDEQGSPTADLEIAKATVGLIEQSCPALVQLSTGVGLDVPFEEREKLVEAKPAMASLNVCSMSFAAGEFRNPPDGVRRLAARMQELGVKPELEIYDTGHLDVALLLRDEGLLQDPLQFSIVLGVRGGMAATPENLVALVSRLPADAIWQAIGIGRGNLAMTTIGLAMGGNARTGMEDTLMLRRGEPAPGKRRARRTAGSRRAFDRARAGDVEEARNGSALGAPVS